MPFFNDNFIGNVFRLWERIFWRKRGVKMEMAKSVYQDEDGKIHEHYTFFTIEAFAIHTEYALRRYFRGVSGKIKSMRVRFSLPDFNIFEVFAPQFAFEGIRIVPNMNNPKGYALAVTFGNDGQDTDQGSGTTSYNNNGDFLYVAVNGTSDITAMSYNSVSMTELGTTYTTSWSGREHSTWTLVNPAQGANNIVATAGANWQFLMFSASGVDQTTPTSGLTTKAEETSANPTIAITTTVNNAYAIASGQCNGVVVAGTNTTQMEYSAGGSFSLHRSTNAVSPAGSFTINITMLSGAWRLRGFGLNPSSTPVTVTPSAQVANFSIPAYTAKHGSTVSPTAQVATFSTPAPTISLPNSVAVGVQTATFSIPAYIVEAGNNTVAVNTQTATFDIPAYSVLRGWTLAVNTQIATFSTPAPTISLPNSVAVGVQTATFSIPAYAVNHGSTISPSAQTATFSIPAYTVTAQTKVQPGVQTATFTLPAYTVTGELNIVISAAVQVLTFSLPSLYKVGAVWRKVGRSTSADWTRVSRNNN